MKKVKQFLHTRAAFRWLIVLNLLSILVGFYTGFIGRFGDEDSYIYMARSLHQGTFTQWYFLPFKTAETVRTWGYPFFLYLMQFFSNGTAAIKFTQLLLHLASIALLLRMIKYYKKELIYRNIFLLLLFPNIQLSYYAGQVATESLSLFLLTAFVYVWYTRQATWTKYGLLAFLAFCVFQVKPAFLVFPFVFFMIEVFFYKQFRYGLGFITAFSLLLLPFGFWNKANHGIFKVTPIEGGAGVAHLGYWQYKLPDNYYEDFYWEQTFPKDIFQPRFYTPEEEQQNAKAYEAEWKEINGQLSGYLTKQDTAQIKAEAAANSELWLVYNSKYTYERESLLLDKIKKNVKEDPGYYIKSRVYVFFRLWFTGIKTEIYKYTSAKQIIAAVTPFLITFVFVFGSLLLVMFFLLKGILDYKVFGGLYAMVVYFGAVHIPFGLQARYTVPVHIFLFVLAAIGIGNLATKVKKTALQQNASLADIP